jgi:hypothetical protein
MAASLRSIAHPTVIHPAPLNLGRIGASSNHVFLFDGPRVGVWQGAIGCRVQQQAPALKKPLHRLAKPKRLMQAVGSLPALAWPPFDALPRTTGMRLVPQPAVMVQE